LPAVFYGLLKHAVFIAKTITARGKLHRGHGIQETGSQTAEPTVTETGVRLLLNKGEPIDVLLVDEIVQERIEQEVSHVVGDRTSDKKLHREIVNTLGIGLIVGFAGKHPALRKDVANRAGEGFVMFARGGLGQVNHPVE
jgi:hypothetical protein